MARRKKSYTRYRTKVKRVYSKGRNFGGSMKPVIDGAIAGAGGQFATKYVGAWGQPIADIGVGIYMKNNTLKTIGGRSLGMQLGGMFSGTGNGSAGAFE
jgi:hypothetical protein